MTVPDSHYRCMKCRFEWVGYRVSWDEKTGMGYTTRHHGGRGPTECPQPRCKNLYVEWVNWEAIRVALGRYWEEEV
jgi:hypothetical protein